MEPETAHDVAIQSLAALGAIGPARSLLRSVYGPRPSDRLAQGLLGTTFANPVGLAAGFDKNARAVRGLSCLGFGFVEVGTVTPRGQPGNPKPRIFRHRRERALQNALGFNNDGMEAVRSRIRGHLPLTFPLGVNIGKNADTELERAESDYEALFSGFGELADYFTVNVSSPNTPGLRDLQAPDRVAGLLEIGRSSTASPILVKLSPDLETAAAVELVEAAAQAGASGVILTNTTTRYGALPGCRRVGGLSGPLLRERSYELLRRVAEVAFGRLVLISVGGIETADDVYRRLKAGASLVQVYTGLVYRGPTLVRELLVGLEECLERDGHARLVDAIGVDLS